MKKSMIIFAAVAFAAMPFISCAGKHSAQDAGKAPESLYGGKTYTLPCDKLDDDEWFYAVGTAIGPRVRMDVLQKAALINAQSMVRTKMKHFYEGIVSEYTPYFGNNQGTDYNVSTEPGGDQILDLLVNETMVWCPIQFTEPDAKGNVDTYVGIKISKKEIASQVADKVEAMVPASERQRIEEDKKNFREYSAKKIKSARGQ